MQAGWASDTSDIDLDAIAQVAPGGRFFATSQKWPNIVMPFYHCSMRICQIWGPEPRTAPLPLRRAQHRNGNRCLPVSCPKIALKVGWPIWRILWQSSRKPAVPQSSTNPLAEHRTKAYYLEWRVLPFSYAVKFQWPYIIRGSWLCLDPGSFIWRPPVHTGPRELSYQHGCSGGPATFICPRSCPQMELIHSEIFCMEASAARSLPQACKYACG